jgi:cytidine deaminase
MSVEEALYEAAVALVQARYPHGWGGAAAMRTRKGAILTSVAPDVIVAATELYIETGAICEAHKLNDPVTHSICVVRDDEHAAFKVLAPCGVCQERLFFWGEDVRAAVSTPDGALLFKPLKELQPYHWAKAYPDGF